MFLRRMLLWLKENRWFSYSCAVATFLVINGVFLFKGIGSTARSILLVAAIAVLLWCLICLVVFQLKKKSIQLNHIFLTILLTLGLGYSAIFPAISVPDERYHFEASYMYSDIIMLQKGESGSLPMREGDKELIERSTKRLEYSSYSKVINNFEFFSSNSSMTTIQPMAQYSLTTNLPQQKIPSAIGITIAKLFGLGSYPLFYLGRLFNFLLFAVLCYFAVKITPVGKNAFMAIALLPMTLHVVSSYSYDAGTIGYAFILIALCLKAIYAPQKIARKDLIALGIFAILLAPCKVLYSVIILMVFLIPQRVFATKRNAILYKIGVPLLSFGFLLLLKFSTLLAMAGADPSSAGNVADRLGEIGRFRSFSEFFTDPLGTIVIYARTIFYMGDFYITGTLGGKLGWFQDDISTPWFIIAVAAALLFLSFLKTPKDETTIPNKHRIAFVAICVVGTFAIWTSMFVSWTFDYEPVIQGVQGRYTLPLLPLIALAFRSNTVTSNKNLHLIIPFGFLAFNLAHLNMIFALATKL